MNVVLHRGNLDRLGEIIEMAARLGADRVELANTQYYGWAHKNRHLLMPTKEQVERSRSIAEAALKEYKGRMQIIYVLPDYYELYPKPCYGGWGSVYILVTPDGKALPCHGATQISHLQFVNVREHALDWIWRESPIFNAFRGDSWMKEPCRSCPRKALDFGGCRCQAFALTGDARQHRSGVHPLPAARAHRAGTDRNHGAGGGIRVSGSGGRYVAPEGTAAIPCRTLLRPVPRCPAAQSGCERPAGWPRQQARRHFLS